MKTHDELYNAIRERLNEMIPERLKLKFGCEVRLFSDYIDTATVLWGECVQCKKHKGNLQEDCYQECELVEGCELYANYYGENESTTEPYSVFVPKEKLEILGTPPTLQEILLALDLVSADIIKISANMMRIEVNEKVAIYNLSKPVKEQETSTLQAIYELIK